MERQRGKGGRWGWRGSFRESARVTYDWHRNDEVLADNPSPAPGRQEGFLAVVAPVTPSNPMNGGRGGRGVSETGIMGIIIWMEA